MRADVFDEDLARPPGAFVAAVAALSYAVGALPLILAILVLTGTFSSSQGDQPPGG